MQLLNIIPEADRDIYIYGLNNGCTILINFVTVLIISLILQKEAIFIVLMLSFIPLRSFSGGIHCNSKILCYVLSTLIIIILLKIQGFLTQNLYITWIYSILCSIYTMSISTGSSKVRSLTQIEIRHYNKKKNVLIIVLNVLIILMLVSELFIYATTLMSSIILVATLLFFEQHKKKKDAKNNF
ncbi:MAG: accessory gene regulator B family protein [Lachnospiraceae bacterium]